MYFTEFLKYNTIQKIYSKGHQVDLEYLIAHSFLKSAKGQADA